MGEYNFSRGQNGERDAWRGQKRGLPRLSRLGAQFVGNGPYFPYRDVIIAIFYCSQCLCHDAGARILDATNSIQQGALASGLFSDKAWEIASVQQC